MYNIDLHIHTNVSDGSLSPTQAVEEAVEAGLRVIAITDHDTTDGIAEAEAAAKEHEIVLVPGVEISTTHPRGEVHILGYWMDYRDPEFQEFLKRPRATRTSRIREMCRRLTELGLPVRAEEVFEVAGSTENVGRPHLAKLLVAKGYVEGMDEAFQRYLGEGCPAYVKRFKNRTGETIEMIHRHGGVSVIAHPGLIHDPELVTDLIREGVMGIEVICHEHDQAMVERFSALADRHGLLKTGGSDYHGDMLEKSFRLGDLKVPYAFYVELERARKKVTS